MKIRRHYLALYSHFPAAAERQPVETTTQELADVLGCTHRNMILLLRRMQEEGWLHWLPKRGRANRSKLTFLASKDELTLLEVQELVDNKDLRSALALLHASEETAPLRSQFQQWLNGQFGFHTEGDGERRFDVLRFPLPQTIHSLDPAAIHYTGESHLVNQLFDSLVLFNPAGDGILPHLAHAWEADKTRTCWTFYLRKGVRFHHGREMRAADVKYSLERLIRLAPGGLYSWAYRNIRAIEAVDAVTVRCWLTERNELFPAFLATNRASIVPEEVCTAAGEQFGQAPVGTGPFQLAGQEQEVWLLNAFPDYFQGRGFLDQVEIWTMPPANPPAGAPVPESFQVMHNVRLSEEQAGKLQQVRQSGMTCKYLTVNEEKPGPLSDPIARARLDRALNRSRLLRHLSGDVTQSCDSFWPDGTDMEQAEQGAAATEEWPVDHAAVQAAMGEPPVDHAGEPAALHGDMAAEQLPPLVLATIPQYEHDAELVKLTLAEAGITLDIHLIPAEQFTGKERMAADLLLFAIMLDEQRELRLIDLFLSIADHSGPKLRDALNEGIRKLFQEPDAAKRTGLFLELEQLLKSRNSLLFLYRKSLKTAFHPSVRGISLDSFGWVRFRDIWFSQTEEVSEAEV
jgi:MarR-like DNA-binding transcriptional regulator SgrR of sgrS sRNA